MIILSVILPTYNEHLNIEPLIEKLENVLKNTPSEIIIVDDNSPDLTWQLAQELAATRPYLRVIRRLHDHGLSPAVMDGFAASRGKYLAVMDADMQHDETVLPQFIEAFEKGADLVVGSRKVAGGKVEDWSVIRKFISFSAGTMAKTILTKSVTDPMSGYFALRREVYDDLGQIINPRGFKILLEFLARSKDKKIVEVGYTFRGRQHGESKLSTNVMFEYLSALYDLSFAKYISRRFMKYALVGLSGVAVNQFFVWSAKYFLNFENKYALVVGIEASIVSNFFLNNFWTFRKATLKGMWPLTRGLLSFNSICLGGAVINFAIALFVYDFWQNIYLTNLFGIVMATVWNYVVNSTFTWTTNRRQ